MALAWLLAVVVLMAYDPFDVGGGDDAGGSGSGGAGGADGGDGGVLPPGCLPGDSLEAIITGPDGSLRITPHHDDWEDVQWRGADAMAHHRTIYRDAVVPDITPPWLIMEPATHAFFDRESVRSTSDCKCK